MSTVENVHLVDIKEDGTLGAEILDEQLRDLHLKFGAGEVQQIFILRSSDTRWNRNEGYVLVSLQYGTKMVPWRIDAEKPWSAVPGKTHLRYLGRKRITNTFFHFSHE